MIIVADTGPVNYLVLSGYISLLHELYGGLIIPSAVHKELLHTRSPAVVRNWADRMPAWAEVRSAPSDSSLADLGPGEREAITLAMNLHADFLLIDESLGRAVAVQNGLTIKGTLGVIEDAADHRLVNLVEAIQRVRDTGIYLSDELVRTVLDRCPSKR